MSTEVNWTCANGHANSEVVNSHQNSFDVVLGLKCGTCGAGPLAPVTFNYYTLRLQSLAKRHHIGVAELKALIEDAYGKTDSPPAAKEAELALRKLARLGIKAKEINQLFQYSIER